MNFPGGGRELFVFTRPVTLLWRIFVATPKNALVQGGGKPVRLWLGVGLQRKTFLTFFARPRWNFTGRASKTQKAPIQNP